MHEMKTLQVGHESWFMCQNDIPACMQMSLL